MFKAFVVTGFEFCHSSNCEIWPQCSVIKTLFALTLFLFQRIRIIHAESIFHAASKTTCSRFTNNDTFHNTSITAQQCKFNPNNIIQQSVIANCIYYYKQNMLLLTVSL